jgi:molybdopterin-containing oxidoreductase family iron-sulfur binding subunit
MDAQTIDRRRFLIKGAGVTVAAVAASSAVLAIARKAEDARAAVGTVDAGLNETLRLQSDLQRALAKPLAERKWGMVIDLRKCIGCSACTVACIAENNLPPGVTYRVVKEVEDGDYPALRRYFMPTNCMQCENPPCMEAANKLAPGAVAKRPDGIVEFDYAKLRGDEVVGAAQRACPYTAIYRDNGGNYTDATPALQSYEKREVFEYGQRRSREKTAGAGRKCHFCIQRIEAGVLPACVTTCTGQAMYFGDLNDPDGLTSELRQRSKSYQMHASTGIGPKIYYLDNEPQESCAKCHE